MVISPDIEPTEDGSVTLRHPVYRETYHSVRGALGEAKHIFINNGLLSVPQDSVSILEVGFGTGLNAWLTLEHARHSGRKIDYHTVELYPVSLKTAASLGYTDDPLFMRLHECHWGEKTDIIPGFALTKLEADLGEVEFSAKFDLIYFDAFAPDAQPEMWTPKVFSWLNGEMARGGVLVTYSAKGTVKRALRAAGFEVKRIQGALGKRHMVRAVKM